MARYTITTGASASVNNVAPASATTYFALSAAAAVSLWLLTPGTNQFVIVEFGVGFDASTASAPVQVMLYRVRTAGSPAGVTGNINKSDPNSGAADTTVLTDLTTETSNIDVLFNWPVAANNGWFVEQWPLGREPFAPTVGAKIGLLAKTPASVSPNASSYVVIEE